MSIAAPSTIGGNLTSPYAAVTLGNAIEIFRASGAPDIDTIDLAMGSWIDTIT